LPFSVLLTSQEHDVLVVASYGRAISLVSSRLPSVRPKHNVFCQPLGHLSVTCCRFLFY